MEKDSIQADSGVFDADADQGDVADSPADEENEFGDTDTDAEDTDEDEQDSEDKKGASGDEDSDGEDAAPAKPQPKKKPVQSKHDDTKYATARKDAEARLRTAKAENDALKLKMDSFARSVGYKDYADMERGEQVKRLVSGGMSEESAQEIATLRSELAEMKEALASTKEAAKRQELFNQLFDAYPELRTAESLPDEVADAIDAGETPLNAYRAWENKNLRERLRVLEQRKKNSKKAVGSAKGVSTGKAKRDDFTSGLFE